jgi:hypothetical protein
MDIFFLSFAGKLLSDDVMYLTDYDIVNGSHIELTIRGFGGAPKGVKKSDRVRKVDKLKMSAEKLKLALGTLEDAGGMDIVASTRASVAEFMSCVSKKSDALSTRINGAKNIQKMQLLKSLQSNNIEHRLEYLARAGFANQFEAIDKARIRLDECVAAMMQVTQYALTKEYCDESGTVSWKSLTDLLTGCGEVDDDLKDCLYSMSLLVPLMRFLFVDTVSASKTSWMRSPCQRGPYPTSLGPRPLGCGARVQQVLVQDLLDAEPVSKTSWSKTSWMRNPRKLRVQEVLVQEVLDAEPVSKRSWSKRSWMRSPCPRGLGPRGLGCGARVEKFDANDRHARISRQGSSQRDEGRLSSGEGSLHFRPIVVFGMEQTFTPSRVAFFGQAP